MGKHKFMVPKLLPSTRSYENEDAYRDFDHFDPNEELRRMRIAMRASGLPTVSTAMRRQGMRVAVELAANLDEWMSLAGTLPRAWLGPVCMNPKAAMRRRLNAALESEEPAKMPDYVQVGSPGSRHRTSHNTKPGTMKALMKAKKRAE